jgi:hypothetical protein
MEVLGIVKHLSHVSNYHDRANQDKGEEVSHELGIIIYHNPL